MGGRWSFDEYRHVRAPVDVVWDVVSDHRRYSGWTSVTTSILEQEGRGHPDGVGAIRFLGVGRIGAREQVLDFDPPHHLAYTILSGPPARAYRADVHLMPTSDGGTDLRWTGSFASAPPGLARLTRALLAGAVRELATRATREAERRAGVGAGAGAATPASS